MAAMKKLCWRYPGWNVGRAGITARAEIHHVISLKAPQDPQTDRSVIERSILLHWKNAIVDPIMFAY